MTPNPTALLRDMADTARELADDWDRYELTEVALLPAVMRAAGGDGRGSGHPDPSGNLAVALEVRADRIETHYDEQGRLITDVRRYHETLAELHEAYGHLRAVQKRVALIVKHHPSIAADADQTLSRTRCVGTVDPYCTNNWVVAPDHPESKFGGLCWKCIKRLQRSGVQDHPSIVQPDVLETGTIAAPTLKQVGASSSAWVTCTQCPAVGGELARFDVPAGLDPQVWLDRHRISEHSA